MKEGNSVLENLELRSESVQDILTRPPNWMIMWGNTAILLCLSLVLIMSCFIKYPEFIAAPILITSKNPPEKIVARTSSKIEKIFIKNGDKVLKDEILMVLQSSANFRDVLKLREMVDSFEQTNILNFPIHKVSTFKLGDLQIDYNNFANALQDQSLYFRFQPYAPESLAINQSLEEIKDRILTQKQQQKLEQAKFQLSKKNYERSQDLFEKGIIASSELEREKINFLQAQQDLENNNILLSQSEESIYNLEKTKSGLSISSEKDRINYSSQTLQLFEQLRKSLKQWEQAYLIVSSIKGVVSFQQFWGENQFLQNGEAILSILPEVKEGIVGRMFVPSINSGKIEKGQKVLLKLDNFQYQEYGIVKGQVQNISLTPNKDGNYYVNIVLPEDLKTSYNKILPFNKELRGTAEIVTKDLRLIERLFYKFKELLG